LPLFASCTLMKKTVALQTQKNGPVAQGIEHLTLSSLP
jgi:hypothetical protein